MPSWATTPIMTLAPTVVRRHLAKMASVWLWLLTSILTTPKPSLRTPTQFPWSQVLIIGSIQTRVLVRGILTTILFLYADPTEGNCPFGGVYEADSYMGQKICKVAQFGSGASNVRVFNTLDKMYVQYDSSVEGQCAQGRDQSVC